MNLKQFLTTILVAILVVGCTKDDHVNQTRISGIYKITAINAAVALDLNNDGVKSTDIYNEIKYYSLIKDLSSEMFYDFESTQNYMVARPLPYHTNNAQLISLNVPDQVIDTFGGDLYYLSNYIHSFTAYSYELNGGSDVVTLHANDATIEENGTLKEMRIIEDGHLRLTMTKKFFDFTDLAWVETEVTIDYVMV